VGLGGQVTQQRIGHFAELPDAGIRGEVADDPFVVPSPTGPGTRRSPGSGPPVLSYSWIVQTCAHSYGGLSEGHHGSQSATFHLNVFLPHDVIAHHNVLIFMDNVVAVNGIFAKEVPESKKDLDLLAGIEE
jgi:hypothetical protein